VVAQHVEQRRSVIGNDDIAAVDAEVGQRISGGVAQLAGRLS
jgi:hypothetical protein